MKSELGLEALRAELERTGEYRVLRKLRTPVAINPPALARTGLFIDVETTGLDPARHEIIELAMVPFFYLPDGDIVGVGEPFSGLTQPASSIPPAITALTGIDDAMVAGQAIDPDAVAAFVSAASLVVAHNAGFDRKFVERFKAREGRPPASWQELATAERLRGVPLDSTATPFVLDPATGRIDVSRQSTLWPLPTSETASGGQQPPLPPK